MSYFSFVVLQEKDLQQFYDSSMLPISEIVLPQLSSNVPAFLAKLWKMVDDPDTDHLIAWGDYGNTFVMDPYKWE